VRLSSFNTLVHIMYLVPALLVFAPTATATPVDPNLPVLRAILKQPDAEIDLAKVKLTIDHMIDPSINIDSSLRQLDNMVTMLRMGLPPNPTSWQIMLGLRSYLYEAGPWNNYQKYQYDLSDPFGKNINNKLLPIYMATHKGNCASMPLLFIILGQKLGIDVTASTAPNHLFVKYRDDQGKTYNLEATSDARPTRDEWVRQQSPMTDEALKNRVYMQALTKHETVVVMMGTLVEYYEQQGWQEKLIALSNLSLEYYPNYVADIVFEANAYYDLMQQHFMSKYPTPQDIPLDQRPYFLSLYDNRKRYHDRAVALGWRPPSAEAEARYAQRIKRMELAQQEGN